MNIKLPIIGDKINYKRSRVICKITMINNNNNNSRKENEN